MFRRNACRQNWPKVIPENEAACSASSRNCSEILIDVVLSRSAVYRLGYVGIIHSMALRSRLSEDIYERRICLEFFMCNHGSTTTR